MQWIYFNNTNCLKLVSRQACLLIFILIFSFQSYTQHKINSWLFGMQPTNLVSSLPDTGVNKEFGGNFLNFNATPFSQSRVLRSLGTSWNIVNMWDANGNFLFYSNGSKVFNWQHQLIENADSLNYSNYWVNSVEGGYYADYIIGSYANSMMSFRSPSNANQYYLVSTIMNYDNFSQTQWLRFHRVVYSIVDMSLNNGRGKMIVKEQNLLGGDFSHAISACKHANGRDWWITARGYQDTNCYYFFKLDDKGISYDHKQCIGVNFTMKFPDSLTACYGSNYSPDGKQYSILSHKGLEVFDFDRCKGIFSNPRYASYPFNADDKLYKWFQTLNVCFSPNNQYIYAIVAGIKGDKNLDKLYQFDTKADDFKGSQETVGVYDGFKDHYKNDTKLVGFQTTFSTMQLAPDGKIYLGNGEGARYLHEIEFPDKKGVACNLKQHHIRLLTYTGGVPYYPNYNLGADTCAGSAITETEALDIKVYPNPTRDFVSVSLTTNVISASTVIPANLSGSQHHEAGIYMYNLLGQQVFPSMEVSKVGFRLDVSALSEGIYLLQLRDKTGSVLKTEKVMISR
jgi:hypothetical protein